MISLAGFQILLLLRFFQFLVSPPTETTVPFNLPSLGKGNYSQFTMLKEMNSRAAITYNFTGNEELDDSTFNKIQLKTRELRASNDTLHAIKVHFTATATYGEFVHLNSLMKIEMQPRYTLVEDDFYIWEENDKSY